MIMILPRTTLLMGDTAYTNFLSCIEDRIAEVKYYLKRYKKKHDYDENNAQGGIKHKKSQAMLTRKHAEIDKLNNFLTDIRMRWGVPKDRVIGFVC